MEILLKLVKRNGQATICFETKVGGIVFEFTFLYDCLVTSNFCSFVITSQGDFDVTHDIPIRLLKGSEMETFQKPRIIPPQVCFTYDTSEKNNEKRFDLKTNEFEIIYAVLGADSNACP
jgi:hypothetical protein